MKRSGVVKFPNSVQLFKLCQKIMIDQNGGKVHDQEVGAILNFNPSDCSHWKRGEKNVKSVYSLAGLAEQLSIETSLIHDVASGVASLDEAYYEYGEAKSLRTTLSKVVASPLSHVQAVRDRVTKFVNELHGQAGFTTPPLYLPEIMRFFPFISLQQTDMMDRLSRILRVKPGQYIIQYKKGELKPQIRMSIIRDLARIIFEAERSQFSELGPKDDLIEFEKILFIAEFLVPQHMLSPELAKIDSRKNTVSELSSLFWVPKTLIGFQMQDLLRIGGSTAVVKAGDQGVSSEKVAEL